MQHTINGVVVFASRADLISSVRSIARQLGVVDENFIEVKTPEQCRKVASNQDQWLLVLDWDIGPSDILKVLKSECGIENRDKHFSLLVAQEMSSQVIECGTEHFVTRVHTGQLSPTSLRLVIQEVFAEASEVAGIRREMAEVRNARTQGHWAQATMILQGLYKDDPENPRIAVELAENYLQAEQWQKAYQILEPFKGREPPYTRALHMLGRCYIKLDRVSEAANVLEKAKIINPYNVERLVELGNVFLKIDRVEQAKEVFSEALHLEPDDIGATQGKGHCMLMDGEVNEGLQLLRQVSNNRELASIFNTAAIMTIRRGEFQQGLYLYDAAIKALESDTKNLARIYYNKGIGFYRHRHDKLAHECFNTAVELDPEHENARFNAEKMAEKSSMPMVSGEPAPTSVKSPSQELQEFREMSDMLDDDFEDAFADDDERI